ncbi:aminotransferase class I/II-fold pyridoxal phosphate-dependent enzyme [uncultured Nocardioides sp.]|uniref:DegT/DnrJ/EryC1/StrS family aminotransferase n=1 Tax=uncultured Nocardioides sp. TaxID=198441 RepID=UPI00262A2CE6|nr:aminotransferase class I/II-fold pyridoxal phosphate-dependent enzyme [uncultured Nocardioides sp.]
MGELEQEAVLRAMRSGWVAPAGPDLLAFEEEVAARVGVQHAVALASGTAALHLALVSWGVGPGDVVPVSTLTFAATVNAIRYVGAEPHFVDSRTDDGNIDTDLLAQAVDELLAAGRRVPAIVPVDLLGRCVDLEAVTKIAESAEARLLCDSAESFGATHAGRPAGAWGDASVLSFNGNKIMTTSGGGMLLTDDGALAAHVRKLSTQAREPVPHYEHTEVGYNYRLSNILAAMGRAQLSRLDGMIERRRGWRRRYREIVAELPGVRVLGSDDPNDDAHDNCWLTALVVDPERAGTTARDVGQALLSVGIESRPVWKPMHLQPVYAEHSATLDGTAEHVFNLGLTLPSGSGMSEAQFGEVTDVLAKALR